MGLEPGDMAVAVVEISKDNRLCGTGLLAGGPHLAVADLAVLFFGRNSRSADPLYTVGAFLHDTPPANSDFGVVHRLVIGQLVICISQEIEAAHFVWAVVRTETCADATIINLKVEALVIVDGSFHGAN